MTKENVRKMEDSVSFFARSEDLFTNDPLEEIFALNLGDFLTEHLISEDLAQKIKKHETQSTQISYLVSYPTNGCKFSTSS